MTNWPQVEVRGRHLVGEDPARLGARRLFNLVEVLVADAVGAALACRVADALVDPAEVVATWLEAPEAAPPGAPADRHPAADEESWGTTPAARRGAAAMEALAARVGGRRG